MTGPNDDMDANPMSVPHPAVCGWRGGWYVVPHEVTWRDLDGIGHVNNATYFSYFEWARTKYWFALHGIENKQDLGVADLTFIVAHAQCDFRLQLSLAEKLDVCVRIGDMRTSSFDFLYEIRRRERRDLAATGKVVVVHYSWEKNAKMVIPKELRARVERFQKG